MYQYKSCTILSNPQLNSFQLCQTIGIRLPFIIFLAFDLNSSIYSGFFYLKSSLTRNSLMFSSSEPKNDGVSAPVDIVPSLRTWSKLSIPITPRSPAMASLEFPIQSYLPKLKLSGLILSSFWSTHYKLQARNSVSWLSAKVMDSNSQQQYGLSGLWSGKMILLLIIYTNPSQKPMFRMARTASAFSGKKPTNTSLLALEQKMICTWMVFSGGVGGGLGGSYRVIKLNGALILLLMIFHTSEDMQAHSTFFCGWGERNTLLNFKQLLLCSSSAMMPSSNYNRKESLNERQSVHIFFQCKGRIDKLIDARDMLIILAKLFPPAIGQTVPFSGYQIGDPVFEVQLVLKEGVDVRFHVLKFLYYFYISGFYNAI